ncbi:unnamed protein product [Symbiodinium sp. CCMP2592]|nr:unnamed protein product [Symbiodinium sp. CCMP2592]
MECCRIESNVRDAERWDQPPPCRWSLVQADALQALKMQCQEPIYLSCPFGPHLWWHFRTWVVDGERVWVYYSGHCFHLAIRKIRPDVHVCFEMIQDGPCKKLSVRYALSGDFILELKEPKQNRISLGSVETVLRWQLGPTEQQNIVSHEQPPVVFDTSDAESQLSETSHTDIFETEPDLSDA